MDARSVRGKTTVRWRRKASDPRIDADSGAAGTARSSARKRKILPVDAPVALPPPSGESTMQRDLRHSTRCVRVLALILASLGALNPFLAHGATSSGLSIS